MLNKNTQTQTKIKAKKENKTAERLLALIIALLMCIGCVPAVLAGDAEAEEEAVVDKAKLEAERIGRFLTAVYDNPEHKLKTFGKEELAVTGVGKTQVISYLTNENTPEYTPVFTKDGFELYYHSETGEVAVRELATGQIMFSNPWDIGVTTSAQSEDVRRTLMSQLIIGFSDQAGRESEFNSFKDAALNKQIKMKRINGGIRVEYTIGREQKRRLVPKMIEKSSLENKIYAPIGEKATEREYEKIKAYYLLKDINKPGLSERAIKEMIATYPETANIALYTFDPGASERELREVEEIIRKYTKYTFDMMEEDHKTAGYVEPLKSPPLFKLALEYYIDAEGLYVRLPVNGLRFDESSYKISFIKVLPFMGAGRRGSAGYTFIPDGSGALVRYEDIKAESFKLQNRVYGPDYAFFDAPGGDHTRKWRLPVYGAVETYRTVQGIATEEREIFYNTRTGSKGRKTLLYMNDDGVRAYLDAETGEEVLFEPGESFVYYDENGEPMSGPKKIFVDKAGNEYDRQQDRYYQWRIDGYLAIIEEGDVMANIWSDHGGPSHIYNTAYSQFSPRPTDFFWLNIDVSGINGMVNMAAKRKYTGNYIVKYIMLSSNADGTPVKKDGYEATYVGMARAYQDYLVSRGQLTPLKDDGSKDIPLFIESLGAIKTAEYFMGMPYEGTTPLTTFDDIKTIIDELNQNNITNIRFRLNGWMNGGMKPEAPTKVSVINELGGKKGLAGAIEYAKEKGAVIYPDIDFNRLWRFKAFDGTDDKLDTARYMNQNWAREQDYCYICQTIEPWNVHFIISPDRMEQMYNRAMKDYTKINKDNGGIGAVSVVSMANGLNSNNYEKNLVNRAESKEYVLSLFEKMYADHGNIIAEKANAYTFKYLDSILSADLDSSRFQNESESIPFYGMVTHGYINITGEPINMSGDMRYDVLKSIENGASPYFVLSYRNSNRLKESMWSLNTYYSVDYSVWLSDMLKIYKELNDALGPVKTQVITDHAFPGKNVVKVTYGGGVSFVINYNNFNCIVMNADGKSTMLKCEDPYHENCAQAEGFSENDRVLPANFKRFDK